MAKFEQAIFTSARTQHGEGYHLTSRSAGISSEMAKELSRWGPSHDCLVQSALDKRSVNFCRLSDGSLCTSLTFAAGAEKSGRAGERMFTHFLVATEASMLEFANDPFALVRAADALGLYDDLEADRGELPLATLAGTSAVVDVDLLAQAAKRPHVERVAQLLSVCLTDSYIAVAGAADLEFLVQAVLHLLPVRWRANLSFSTALRRSPRRPYRLLAAPDGKAEQRRLERTFDTTVVDLAASRDRADTSTSPWAAMVAQHLREGQIARLAEAIANHREPVLGSPEKHKTSKKAGTRSAVVDSTENRSAANTAIASLPCTRADASHRKAADVQHAMPGHLIGADHGELMDLFEQLDDAVFDAIAGDADALERLRQLWPKFCHGIDPALVEESKEQYLRYVVERWREPTASDRNPASAIALLDIVSLLFDSE